MKIPRSALILGLAGVLPFVFGALIASGIFSAHMGQPDDVNSYPLVIAKDGQDLLLRYGTIILAFMSGVLWGFATKAPSDRATLAYSLSVVPALWVFFTGAQVQTGGLISLALGFVGLLVLDWQFSRWGLTPLWWMQLRILLTSLVMLCLVVGIVV